MKKTRDCAACGRKYACVWVDDAWVCRFVTCGAEFYPYDYDAEAPNPYAVPS